MAFPAGDLGALVQQGDGADCRGPGRFLGVQRFLAQDPFIEVTQRLAGVDAEIIGERRLHPAVRGQRVGLAVGEVVGRDQLGPQRLAVGVLRGQDFEVDDHGRGASASDFGLRLRGVDQNLFLHERGGKGVDELKVAQVLEHRSPPLRQCRRQVLASLLEPAGRRRVHARGLLGDEPPQIATVFGDAEPVTRWRRGQHDSWVDTGAA